MQIKHILYLVIVVILWYIYLNKCMCIETFNIGIPRINRPNNILQCGNPFNTTVGDNTTQFKANQLSDPLLLVDNTYLFDEDGNMLDPIDGDIDSSHGTRLFVKCDQGDPGLRYSPYNSNNMIQYKQLEDIMATPQPLLEQIATITCNAPVELSEDESNVLMPPDIGFDVGLPGNVYNIMTNLKTCVISGCHSSFDELVGYELSLPPRMSIYSYENDGSCFVRPIIEELKRFINFLLSIPSKYHAYILYLEGITSNTIRQDFIDNLTISLDEMHQMYGKPIHMKGYQNLQLIYTLDYQTLWEYIFLLRNIKHYTNICGSMGQDLMHVDHSVVVEGTLSMYTSSVEIQNYTPIPPTQRYITIERDIEEGKGVASGGESKPDDLKDGSAGGLGFAGYFVFGGNFYTRREQFDLSKIGPWLTDLSMVYFHRYYEATDHRFTGEEITVTIMGVSPVTVTSSCPVLIKDYLFRRGNLDGLFTLRFEPITGGSKANYNFRIPAENYHLLRRIIQQLIISTCVSIDKSKLRIGRMDGAMIGRLFPGSNQTVKLPIFCFSTYLFDFFRNYSEGGGVHLYTEYAIDETAGPYTSEDIRYVMEEIVDQIITKDGSYYEVYKNILINMGIQDPDVWITRYVSNTMMLERPLNLRCFQEPYEPPTSRPFNDLDSFLNRFACFSTGGRPAGGDCSYVSTDPIHWLTHLWECWGFSDFNTQYSIYELNADALLLLLQLFKQYDIKGLHIHTLTCMTNPHDVTPEKEASIDYEWEYRYNVDEHKNVVDKIGPTCEKLRCNERTLRDDLRERPEYEFVNRTLPPNLFPRYRETVYKHKDVVPVEGALPSGQKQLFIPPHPLAATPVLVKCKEEYENQDSQEIVCKYNWEDIENFRYPGLSTREGEVDFKEDISRLPDCELSDRLTTSSSAIEASQPTSSCAARSSQECRAELTKRGELKFAFNC